MQFQDVDIPVRIPRHVVVDFDKDAPEGFEDDVHLAWHKLQIMLPKTLHGLHERRFPDPLKVDFRRTAQRHAGFGDGPHRCPGARLARTEIRVYLEEWLRRIPDFHIDADEKPRCTTGTANAMVSLRLRWDKPRHECRNPDVPALRVDRQANL